MHATPTVAAHRRALYRNAESRAALKKAFDELRSEGVTGLHYLTGETQGRSVYAWQSWLEDRQAAQR